MKPNLIRISAMLMAFGSLVFIPLAATAADTFKVDPVHSAVVFRIQHLGISYVQGRFNNVAGTIVFDNKAPENSSTEISVKVEDIDTFNAERDQHLRSSDFFDAEKYPVISFQSDKFKKMSDNIYSVSGRLTCHGVTRPITVKVRHIGSGYDPWGGFRAGFETSFVIKRSDFGMTHMLGGVGDEVGLTVTIEGIRQ